MWGVSTPSDGRSAIKAANDCSIVHGNRIVKMENLQVSGQRELQSLIRIAYYLDVVGLDTLVNHSLFAAIDCNIVARTGCFDAGGLPEVASRPASNQQSTQGNQDL